MYAEKFGEWQLVQNVAAEMLFLTRMKVLSCSTTHPMLFRTRKTGPNTLIPTYRCDRDCQSTFWPFLLDKSTTTHFLSPLTGTWCWLIPTKHIFTGESSYCFQHILAIAILSVCLSICHTGGSVKNGAR